MHWVKNNLVGLLTLVLVMGGSCMTLYIKVAVNAEAIAQFDKKLDTFNTTNSRLITSLDKLELLYNESRVNAARQDERLIQTNRDLEKLERKYNANSK